MASVLLRLDHGDGSERVRQIELTRLPRRGDVLLIDEKGWGVERVAKAEVDQIDFDVFCSPAG